jgi:hypothetical protein
MRGPNVGTATSSGQRSALSTAWWWHSQHDTSSDRAPSSRMLPSVIGSIGWSKRASLGIQIENVHGQSWMMGGEYRKRFGAETRPNPFVAAPIVVAGASIAGRLKGKFDCHDLKPTARRPVKQCVNIRFNKRSGRPHGDE